MNSKSLLLFMATLLLHPLVLYPQHEKAQNILSEVSEALKKVNSVSYNFVYKGYGKYNGHFSGQVHMTGTLPVISAYVDLKSLNDQATVVKREEITIHEGQKVTLTDHTQKTFQYGTMTGGSVHLCSYATYAIIFEYAHPQPFATSLANTSLQYEGDTVLSGHDLDRVSVTNQFGDKVIWMTGKKDRMIYAQQTQNTSPGEEGGFFFTMRNFHFNSPVESDLFAPMSPDGYESIDEDNRKLSVGAEAPGWFLPGSP